MQDSFGNSFFGVFLVIGLLFFIFEGDPDIHDAIRNYMLTWSTLCQESNP